jgi:KUP system potassium uptake protein
MSTWFLAKKISKNYTKIVKINDYKKVLAELSVDLSIPKYATHLVYMTNSTRSDEIEEKVMYSILQKRPKRADLYWFIHVNILSEPYRKNTELPKLLKMTFIELTSILVLENLPKLI